MVGIVFGLYFADAGWDGSKTISNFGFFMCTCVYLGYTSMMPAVLRCECRFKLRAQSARSDHRGSR